LDSHRKAPEITEALPIDKGQISSLEASMISPDQGKSVKIPMASLMTSQSPASPQEADPVNLLVATAVSNLDLLLKDPVQLANLQGALEGRALALVLDNLATLVADRIRQVLQGKTPQV